MTTNLVHDVDIQMENENESNETSDHQNGGEKTFSNELKEQNILSHQENSYQKVDDHPEENNSQNNSSEEDKPTSYRNNKDLNVSNAVETKIPDKNTIYVSEKHPDEAGKKKRN